MTNAKPELRVIAQGAMLSALAVSSCNAAIDAGNAPIAETAKNDRPQPEIHCAATPVKSGRVIVRYEIRNRGSKTVHIVDNHRVPYELARGANTLVILHGVHPHDPEVLPHIVEIPLTRALAPGETFTGQLVWPADGMRDHYGASDAPETLLHGTLKVRCEAGWWETPITEANRIQRSFGDLLASQHVVEYGPLNVTLP